MAIINRILCLLLLLASCSKYQLTEDNYIFDFNALGSAATVIGTAQKADHIRAFFSTYHTRVYAVDGKIVNYNAPPFDAKHPWDIAIPLIPGFHQLTVEFRAGFKNTGQGVKATIPISVRPNQHYSLQFSFVNDKALLLRDQQVDFWVINSGTAQTVSPVVRSVKLRDQ